MKITIALIVIGVLIVLALAAAYREGCNRLRGTDMRDYDLF